MTLLEELKIMLKELAGSFSETELNTFADEAQKDIRITSITDNNRNLVLDIAYLRALKAVLSNFDRYYSFSYDGGSINREGAYRNLLQFYNQLQTDIDKRKTAFINSIAIEK